MAEMFKRLKPTGRPAMVTEGGVVLLLDTSGSMITDDGKGRRIDLLREAVGMIEGLRQLMTIAFGMGAKVLEYGMEIPDPYGSTPMHLAFKLATTKGKTKAVLITDGEPDSDMLALDAAKGFVVDIVYIGPEPMPEFLNKLAQQCSGTVQIGKLSDPKLLAHKVTALLGHTKDEAIICT